MYENNRTDVCIICPSHGEFWQLLYNHLRGKGCLICSGKSQKSNNQFIHDAVQIHGNSYDYSKVEYINNYTKVKITCPGYSEISIRFLNDLAREWKVMIQHAENKGGISNRRS